jgi:cytidine deaminase
MGEDGNGAAPTEDAVAALAAAVAAGDNDIRAIGIAGANAFDRSLFLDQVLCGACRQWLTELAPGASIYIADVERVFTVGELLPRAFRL